MNEKEAREIVSYEAANNDKGRLPEYYFEAHGYLKCFEQMKPLVEALEDAIDFIPHDVKMENKDKTIYLMAYEALSHFRKVQEEKP